MGISTGGQRLGCPEIAKRPENVGKTLVTIACSTGERYLHRLGGGGAGRGWRLSPAPGGIPQGARKEDPALRRADLAYSGPVMNSVQSVTLTRDCNAVQIPAGNTVTLPAGTEVDITQNPGRLLHGACLGRPVPPGASGRRCPWIESEDVAAVQSGATGDDVNEEMVWETLRVLRSEIPVNIVDLGLVYDMGIEDLPTGNKKVFVKMTLTAPGCGMGATIAGDAQQKIPDVAQGGGCVGGDRLGSALAPEYDHAPGPALVGD